MVSDKMMDRSALLLHFVLLSTALCSLVDAQLIPRRLPGFTLGNGSANAGVQLESYIDLVRYMCWNTHSHTLQCSSLLLLGVITDFATAMPGQQVSVLWIEKDRAAL